MKQINVQHICDIRLVIVWRGLGSAPLGGLDLSSTEVARYGLSGESRRAFLVMEQRRDDRRALKLRAYLVSGSLFVFQ